MMRNPDVSSKDRLKSASLLGEYYALSDSAGKETKTAVCIVDNVPNTNESEINEGAIENVFN